MRRVWRVSDAARAELVVLRKSSADRKTGTPIIFNFTNSSNSKGSHDVNARRFFSSGSSPIRSIIGLFSNKISKEDILLKEIMDAEVKILHDELVLADENSQVRKILEEKGDPIFRRYIDGSAMCELLRQLGSSPFLALEVLNWRRNQADTGPPMTAEEYAKGITVAGRLKKVEVAVELFTEATNKRVRTTSTYNALMSAYMFNSLADKCQSLFRDLKMDAQCEPSIVTFNILLSIFGRLMLVDHMEETLKEINDLKLSFNLATYNNLIAGYLTAWMWEDMERTFQVMEAGPIKPDIYTYFLMLRGYSHSGNLERMEQIYELVRDQVNREFPLIRAMICAYCKSSKSGRVQRIGDLLNLIPQDEYRPWLNVMLIKVYAQEDRLEEMEKSIDEAFEHNTSVATLGIMRCIIASYFRYNAVDKLTDFVRRAEHAGWRLCRSLYHCKMVMYASQNRLDEMENVLNEMETLRFDRTKKTFWILYKAYSSWGQRYKVNQVIGLMWKHGHEVPADVSPS